MCRDCISGHRYRLHKVEYIETLSYNAKEAKEDAYSYINRFPNVSHPTLMEVYRA
nr:MAG TPA: hypothetical protein [Caudoviricetes sp.]